MEYTIRIGKKTVLVHADNARCAAEKGAFWYASDVSKKKIVTLAHVHVQRDPSPKGETYPSQEFRVFVCPHIASSTPVKKGSIYMNPPKSSTTGSYSVTIGMTEWLVTASSMEGAAEKAARRHAAGLEKEVVTLYGLVCRSSFERHRVFRKRWFRIHVCPHIACPYELGKRPNHLDEESGELLPLEEWGFREYVFESGLYPNLTRTETKKLASDAEAVQYAKDQDFDYAWTSRPNENPSTIYQKPDRGTSDSLLAIGARPKANC